MLMPEAEKPLKVLRYLEDFKVGNVTETEEITVTHDMIVSFAKEYDPQPMHLDEVEARDTLFGGLVGSGWQTLLLTLRLVLEARLLGDTPMIGAEFANTRFHAPMRPNDVLKVTAEVIGIRRLKSRQDRGLLDVKVTTKNLSDTVLVTQTWSLVLPCRSQASA